MKLFVSTFCLLLATSFVSNAQLSTVKGLVTDAESGDELIGATVHFSPSFQVKTDIDGKYLLQEVPFGKYSVKVSMATYETLTFSVSIDQAEQTIDFVLGEITLIEEVQVTANIVKERETPVAVSTLDKKLIAEELGSQDLPMVLNSKPGVHATQQGGGDGDARITIRGFDQRNVGVMIDGVPVNDMENGWVYWSNWFGLDQITQQIQVQRGLGATKLAMPSVGGTMNIVTENAFGKPEAKVQQEYGTGNFIRTSVSYKSGMLGNGWGYLLSVSYKQGDGWVDGLYTKGGFYYFKIQKKFENHTLSLSGFGAPQEHAQRSYSQPIAYWDEGYARDLGIVTSGGIINRGRKYNQHYGYYTDENGKKKLKAERRNYYHKPQFTLRDFWKVNERLSWTNTAYMSIGRGGGERMQNTGALIYGDDKTIDWDQIIRNNQEVFSFGSFYPTVDPAYSPTELKSSGIISASVNNHMWIGGVSQADYKINENTKFAGGVDYRWYRGEHYTQLKDLLGGDYFVNFQNHNSPTPMMREGDKFAWADIRNHRDAFMQWIGGFAQIEYAKGRWAAFGNVSFVVNSYEGVDYFKKKELHIDDTIIYIGASDPSVKYNNKIYSHSSKELKYNSTGTKWLAGFTIKAGANLNIDEQQNVFVNVGYLDRTPMFTNVVQTDTFNRLFREIVNEHVYAFEAGYGIRKQKIAINVNGYFTMWENKPWPFGVSIPDPNDPNDMVRVNLNGMDALHIGAEADLAYNIFPNLTAEAMVSYGDWTWQSEEVINVLGTEFKFDATGVHVGDAAQAIYAGSLRWSFVKNAYLKLKYTYFDKYYSNFDPFTLTGTNGGRESWKIPSYGLMSAHLGYTIRLEHSHLNVRLNVFNLFDEMYISDARNGGSFDAKSAEVFFGIGTTYNLAVSYQF